MPNARTKEAIGDIRDKIFEAITRQGGGALALTVPKGYPKRLPDAQGGPVFVCDPQRKILKEDYNLTWAQDGAQLQNHPIDTVDDPGATFRRFLQSMEINEALMYAQLEEYDYEDRAVRKPVQLFGIDLPFWTREAVESVVCGSHPIHHKDAVYDGIDELAYRWAYLTIDDPHLPHHECVHGRLAADYFLGLDFFVSETVHELLLNELEEEPTFIRGIVRDIALTLLGMQFSVWEHGVVRSKRFEAPVAPPYEAWLAHKGVSRIYVGAVNTPFSKSNVIEITYHTI